MAATHDELKEQVRTALGGDPEGFFDVPEIAKDLIKRFGPLDSLDSVPREAFWTAVARNDLTR